jgi:hypothetical protein
LGNYSEEVFLAEISTKKKAPLFNGARFMANGVIQGVV